MKYFVCNTRLSLAPAVAVLSACTLSSSLPAYSQVASASLTGTVTDPSGAPIVGASVTAPNTGTGNTQTV